MGLEPSPSKHINPWGCNRRGKLRHYSPGHESQADVVKLESRDWIVPRPGFWLSLSDGLLEGVSGALDGERPDIDRCLYVPRVIPGITQLILFDDIPTAAMNCCLNFHSITKLLDRVAGLQPRPVSIYGIPKAT